MLLDCFLRCNFRRCLALAIDFLMRWDCESDCWVCSDARSPRPCPGTLMSPGTFCHSGLGNTSVPLVMSSPSWSCLMSCITSLCTLSCWYPSPVANSSHSLHARFQRRHCENCVIRIDRVRLVLVDDDAFPDGRGELWVTSLAILACCSPCCSSCPEFVELSVVFEKSRCSRPSSCRSASWSIPF